VFFLPGEPKAAARRWPGRRRRKQSRAERYRPARPGPGV